MANFIDAMKRPAKLQLFITAFVILFFGFYAKESVCAASIFFAFCVNEHGFPFTGMMTGHIGSVPQEVLEERFFGQFFMRKGGVLFNPALILLNIMAYYLFVAFLFYISNIKRVKKEHHPADAEKTAQTNK